MPPLETLLLSDGRPGHFRLAEGIVAAVGRRRPVALTRLECRRGRWPGLVTAALSNTGRLDRQILGRVYGLTPPEPQSFGLVVSAGAETLAANIAFARLAGAANIFYGSLRAFRPAGFSAVLTSYARLAQAPNQRMVLKPSALPRARMPERTAGRPPEAAALLLGGDAGSTRFSDADWRRLLAFMAAAHQAHGTRWVVANSRRTPQVVSGLVDAELAGSGAVIRFVDVHAGASATLADVFASVQAVVCTDDSSSMISEAIGAGLPTIGVRPADHSLPPDEAGYRAYLTGEGWHRALDIRALAPDVFLSTLNEIEPMVQDPLDHLADLLAALVPDLFNRSA
jgi:uncharacterized protein